MLILRGSSLPSSIHREAYSPSFRRMPFLSSRLPSPSSRSGYVLFSRATHRRVQDMAPAVCTRVESKFLLFKVELFFCRRGKFMLRARIKERLANEDWSVKVLD